MGKQNKPTSQSFTLSSSLPTTTTNVAGPTSFSAIRQDADLWYRIHVLMYDLSNVTIDPSSEKRISATTHELYISEPYFLDSEAKKICTALIDVDDVIEKTKKEEEEAVDNTFVLSSKDDVTVEEMIHHFLSDFFDKRKASGDARPCGPHDMVPIYGRVFGIQKEELKDERFLSRLRRSGIGDLKGKETTISNVKSENEGKRQKRKHS